MGTNRKIIIIITLILLMSFSVTMASEEVMVAERGSPATPSNILNSFYNAISNKNYRNAYSLRTESYRNYYSYDWFYNNWSNNNYIELVYSKSVSSDNYRNTLEIRTYSEDYYNGKLYSAYYRGKAYFIWENGSWKIDEIDVTKE